MVRSGDSGGGAGLVCQEREVEQLVPDDIEELRLVHETVDNVLVVFLFLKCSKDSVPDTQPASIVLVQTVPGDIILRSQAMCHQPPLPVGPVVDPVV